MEKHSISIEREPTIDIEDFDEAMDFIREHMEKGEYPVIAVPTEYAEAARQGIKPRTTSIFDAIIAGTLGREPWPFEKNERILFRIKVPIEQVEPRFTGPKTGPKTHFHGVVMFRGPIPPECLEEITPEA